MHSNKQKIFIYFIAILILLVLFSVSNLIVQSRSRHHANSDFFSFWLGSKLLLSGKNPYDANLWSSKHQEYGASWLGFDAYLYPPALSIITAPISLLGTFNGFVMWVFFSILLTLLSVYLFISPKLDPSDLFKYLIPVILGVILFRPFIVTLIHGQISPLLLFISVLALIKLENETPFYGGFIIGIMVLKPSIGLLIVCLLGIWGIAKRDWHFIAGLFTSGITIWILSSIIMPGWINQYYSVLISKGDQILGLNPTIWGLSGFACNYDQTCTFISGIVFSVLFLLILSIFLFTKGRSLPANLVISLSISTTMMVTPYAWAYDQLLLILPILVLFINFKHQKKPYIITSTLPIFLSLLSLLLAYIGIYLLRDIASFLLSALMFYSTLNLCFTYLQNQSLLEIQVN